MSRTFILRTILLFWCGDYPGLGEATNFKHSGYYACHWCKIKGEYCKGLTRTIYKGYRRWLDNDDIAGREDARFGSPEHRSQPPLRTHRQTVKEGAAAAARPWIRARTGVNGPCPLSVLPKFDLCEDVLGDMMHIIVNWFKHTVPLMQGLRAPKKHSKHVKPKKPVKKFKEKMYMHPQKKIMWKKTEYR